MVDVLSVTCDERETVVVVGGAQSYALTVTNTSLEVGDATAPSRKSSVQRQ